MIASILPLQRLPRRLGIFDYHIPEALAGIVRPGHMVRIPFRASEQLGLVVHTAEKQKTAELKELQGLLNAEPIATPSQLALLPPLAAWYGVSVATGTMGVAVAEVAALLNRAAILAKPPVRKIPPTMLIASTPSAIAIQPMIPNPRRWAGATVGGDMGGGVRAGSRITGGGMTGARVGSRKTGGG